MEKKHIVFIVGGVIIAGGIGIYLYNKSKIPVTVVPVTPPQGANLGTSNVVTQAAAIVNTAIQAGTAINGFTRESFPLKAGMIGPNVKAMQTALKTKFNEVNVSDDGMFGPKTVLALIHKKNATVLDTSVTQDEYNAILAGTKKS